MKPYQFVALIASLLIGHTLSSQEDMDAKKTKKALKSQFKAGSDNRKRARKFKNLNYEKLETDSLMLPTGVEWKLVLADEFDSFNQAIWGKGQPWGRFQGDNPHQYFDDSMVQVEDGFLRLYGAYKPAKFNIKDTLKTIPYAVGLVNTYPGYFDTFGFFAIRAKAPAGPATWPAFWLTGKYEWPPEIDILEMYGEKKGKSTKDQTMSIHYGSIELGTKGFITHSARVPGNTYDVFHIYACWWSKDFIRFYTDGVMVGEIKLPPTLIAQFSKPMVILLNTGFDGKYLKWLEERNLPHCFEIDWIKVYQTIDSSESKSP